MPAMSHRRALTERSWDELFDFLDPQRADRPAASRDSLAIARLLEIRRRLISFYAARGCRDAEDLAEDTILRVAGRCREVAAEYEGDPVRYFYGFARRIFHESVKQSPRGLPMPEPEPWETKEARITCLDRCMDRLTPRARQLMLAYYRDEKGAKIDRRRQLAERIGKSVNGLRIEVHRVKKALRRCVADCLNRTDPEAAWTRIVSDRSGRS